jgi:hypothetical protein
LIINFSIFNILTNVSSYIISENILVKILNIEQFII